MSRSPSPGSRLQLRGIATGLAPLTVAVAAFFGRTKLDQAGRMGFPLDDGWIHLQFAGNLASGHGLAFNLGEWSAGSTSPLWTLLLALPIVLGVPPVVAAKALGVVLTAAVALLGGALAQPVSVHGAPRHLRSDNGPEFIATAILRWLSAADIETACIDPGKPWQNGTDESFNGKFRDECLMLAWFRNRLEAKVGIERWRRHYNEVRPHMSLGYQTPAAYKATLSEGRSPAAPARADQEEHGDDSLTTGAILQ